MLTKVLLTLVFQINQILSLKCVCVKAVISQTLSLTVEEIVLLQSKHSFNCFVID